MTGFRSLAGLFGRDSRGWPGLLGLCLLAASSSGLIPSPARAVTEPNAADRYAVAGPDLAQPTRQVPAPVAAGMRAPARLAEIQADAQTFALTGRELPPHRFTDTGLSSNLAMRDPVAASIETARMHPALVAVDATDLQLSSQKPAGDLTYVHFRQTVDGIPIHSSRVTFLWDEQGRLRMTGTKVYLDDLTGSAPSLRPSWIGEQAARVGATSGMPADLDVSEWEFAEQQWLPVTDPVSSFRLVPVWNIRFRSTNPVGWYDAMVDGETGRLLSRVNRIQYETLEGTLTGWIEPETPGDAPQKLGMPNQFVQVVTTGDPVRVASNADGVYTAELPEAGLYSAANGLVGRFIWVRDAMNGHATPLVQEQVSVPGTFDVEWADDNSNLSQRDLYYHGNVAHAAIRAIDGGPGIFQLDAPMPADADDPSGTCNAFWDGQRINFYAESGRCAATARIADVVYHEYGHAVTQWTYWPEFGPSDIHEGLSDYFAATIRNDSRIGIGFFGAGTTLRNIEPDRVYPDDISSDPHITGLIIAGALWDLRKEVGKEVTDHLFHFARYGQPEDFDDYMFQMLLVDDDDADLSNGTPHFDAIIRNFSKHGIGDFNVSISAPKIPDYENPGPTIDVTLSVFSLLGVDATELALYADLDGSGFTRIPMSATGVPREYRVSIPSPPAETLVPYYWAAADTAGNIARLPEGAPLETYSFYVGTDVIPPSIETDAPTALAENQTRYYFRTQITDNTQRLGDVHVEYRVGAAAVQSLPLTPRGGDEYEATLELGALAAGQDVFYRIVATDQSQDANTGAFPSEGEYRIPVRRGWSWDFEDPVSALQLDGDWEIGAPVEAGFNYSGQQALATKLNDRYTDDLTSYVTWGPIDLSTFDRASLRFRHLVQTELAYDGANVSVTSDPGAGRWTVLKPVGGYTLGRVAALGEAGYSGDLDWSEAIFPLDFQLGEQIYVRFAFASDINVGGLGWYIDDLSLMEAQAYVDADGFQANNGEDSQVSLRWAFPEGVDRNSGRWVGFDLYRTVDGEAFPDQPLNAQPMQFYQYVDNAVVNGTTYRYRLITRYDDGASRGVEAVGTPYAASIGVDVTSVEATVRDFNDLDDGFTVTNRGAGTLRFNVFLADADVEFGDVQATYALPLEGPTDPEVVAEDPQEGASNVDVASISARRWENEGQEYVEFRLDGYGPWGDPTRDWGGVLLLDLDGNLDTAEDAFDLGWSETTNMGWEMGIIFGRFLAQVGLPGVAALVDAGGDTEPRILSLVDFPTDGSSLAFSVPLSEFGSAQAVQMQAVVAYSLGAPPLDYVPDLPEAASWLVRAPRHGQAVQGYQQRIDLALGNPDLPNGIYRAKLLVRSNDQDVPVLELPVTMTVDRGIPPVLRDVRLTPSIAGMQIAILPSGALPPTGVFVERAGGGDGEYARIAGPLAASPDGYYRAVDSSVRVGETYSYRFALDFSGDRHRTYDPVEQVFNPTVPTLQVEAFDYRLSGVMIRFTLDEMLEGSEIFVERSVADQNEYLRLNDSPLSADSSYTVSYLDATVEEGASYDYQFVVVPDGGPEIPYGPYAATYHAFPAELADLEASSSGEGIEVSFTVPSELDLLQGIWIERRPAAGGDFMARNEETLEPDVEGRVTLLDPWSVPWADGLEPGTSYEYRVRLVGPQSREHSYPLEPVTFTPPVPQELALLPSRPNPFRDRVLFRIDLPSATDVSLEVFDTSGRRVAVLMDGSFPAGAHQREWDGEATSGERVPSGVYFARLRAGGAEKRIRVLRVR